jgi:FMN phosphatase YigB (HAD superfamily)
MTRNIKGIIWDLDDTLYSVTPELRAGMRESLARSIVDMGHPITFEDALKMAEDSQAKYRLTYKMLYERFNIQKEDMHLIFHGNLDHNLTVACPDLPQAFAAHPSINHSLMTHASREWALRMLSHLGLSDYFDEAHVFGLEDFDFKHKDETDEIAQHCMNMMGTKAHETAFVEDRDYNLTFPKQLGLTTVLIKHDSQNNVIAPHIDVRFDRAADFLNSLAKARAV